MMTKEGSTKIVTFMTPRAGVLMQGCDLMSYSENALFSLKSSLLPCKDQTSYVYSIDDPLGLSSDVEVWPYKPL